MDRPSALASAFSALGLKNVLFGVHDGAFPRAGPFDLGRGSPYSEGARRLFAFARKEGFTGIQFGPQGLLSEGSASPYEAALFSRNPQNLDLATLVDEGFLGVDEAKALCERTLAQAAREGPHRPSVRAGSWLIARLWELGAAAAQRLPRFEVFRAHNAEWLVPDALYDALGAVHQTPYFRHWRGGAQADLDASLWRAADPHRRARRLELCGAHEPSLWSYAFTQWLLERQHRGMQTSLQALQLRGYGDLQVGFSARDEWATEAWLLRGYRMGAPPSRTNPEGQPWGYPVLDPAQHGTLEAPGPSLRLFLRRVQRMLEDQDGIRVDHPHGIVCPWVYQDGTPDPLRAVQQGARLFDAPDLPDHPQLAAYAIARPEQLDRALPRYADGWVNRLEEAQVARYALFFDALVRTVQERGLRREDVMCEVLSTQPYPLERVMARHGLGRFRVIQKANLDDAADVYRSFNARPEDWVMLGNHDTLPIWAVVASWPAQRRAKAVEDLATRLEPDEGARAAFAQRLDASDGELATAMLADTLVGPAQNAYVYFTDLFGETEPYNVPGTINETNWTMRIPSDFETVHRARVKANKALCLATAARRALRARRLLTPELDAALESP